MKESAAVPQFVKDTLVEMVEVNMVTSETAVHTVGALKAKFAEESVIDVIGKSYLKLMTISSSEYFVKFVDIDTAS